MALLGTGMFLLCLMIFTRLFYVFVSPLMQFPGPIMSRFTNLWRLWDVSTGHAHLTHMRLHKRLGTAVLLGPNFVSLNHPDHIRTIYGDDRFLKVKLTDEFIDTELSTCTECNRVNFTLWLMVGPGTVGFQISSVRQTLQNTVQKSAPLGQSTRCPM